MGLYLHAAQRREVQSSTVQHDPRENSRASTAESDSRPNLVVCPPTSY